MSYYGYSDSEQRPRRSAGRAIRRAFRPIRRLARWLTRPVRFAYRKLLRPLVQSSLRRLRRWPLWNRVERRLEAIGQLEHRAIAWLEAWWESRNWRYLLEATPAILLALVICGTAFFQWQAPKSATINRYKRVLYEAVDDKDPVAAAIYLRKLHALGDDDPEVKHQLALLAAAEDDLRTAYGLMQELASGVGDGDPRAHYWLAMQAGRTTREWTSEGNQEQIGHLRRYLAAQPEDAQGRVMLAQAYVREDDFEQASQQLELAAAINPSANIILAQTYERNDQPRRAEQAFARAEAHFKGRLEREPQDVYSRIYLAEATTKTRGYRTAAAILKQGLDATGDERLRNALAAVYLYQFGKLVEQNRSASGEGLQLLQQALTYVPTEIRALRQLAAFMASDQEGVELSTSMLSQVLAEGKAAAISHMLLAVKLLEQADADRAETHFGIAKRLNPRIPFVLNNLAVGLVNSKKTETALHLSEAAVRLSPDVPQLLATRGRVRLAAGKLEQAKEDLEAAAAELPESAELEELLAELYEKLGEPN